MENQLFIDFAGCVFAAIFGIIVGAISSRFLKGLEFRTYLYPSIICYLFFSLAVGAVTGILIIFFPDYKIFGYGWGTYYINFVLLYSAYWIACLATIRLLTKK